MDTATLLLLALTANNIKTTISSVGSNPFIVQKVNNDNKHDADIESQQQSGEGKKCQIIMMVKGEDTDSLVGYGSGQKRLHYLTINTAVLVSIVGGIMSIIFVSSGLVDIASLLLCTFIGPTIVIQRYKLFKLGTFRTQHNKLRATTNRFIKENQELSSNITQLEKEIIELNDVNTKLDDIVQKTGQSIDELTVLIETNAKLQKQMIQNLQNDILQKIISLSFTSDSDKDLMIDPVELDVLLMRLSTIKGVLFDENKFRNYLKTKSNNLSYSDFIDIASDLQTATIDPYISPTTDVTIQSLHNDIIFFIFKPIAFMDVTTNTIASTTVTAPATTAPTTVDAAGSPAVVVAPLETQAIENTTS